MKTLLSALFVASLLLLVGCSSSNLGHKYNYLEPNTNINNNVGYLKVFTDKYKEKGIYGEDPANEVYKGYSIYTTNGDFITDVEKSYEIPKLVRLEEGEYVVIAELHKNVVQSFVVSVEKGKMLEIDKSMVKNPLAMD
ncbi:MAG: hypothetical protein P8Z35_00560 [Ignavibacteriaceae bacterium]